MLLLVNAFELVAESYPLFMMTAFDLIVFHHPLKDFVVSANNDILIAMQQHRYPKLFWSKMFSQLSMVC